MGKGVAMSMVRVLRALSRATAMLAVPMVTVSQAMPNVGALQMRRRVMVTSVMGGWYCGLMQRWVLRRGWAAGGGLGWCTGARRGRLMPGILGVLVGAGVLVAVACLPGGVGGGGWPCGAGAAGGRLPV